MPGLSPPQRQMCIESPDAVSSLALGQVLAASECEHQFKGNNGPFLPHRRADNLQLHIDLFSSAGHRWNCSRVWRKDSFGHIMVVGKCTTKCVRVERCQLASDCPLIEIIAGRLMTIWSVRLFAHIQCSPTIWSRIRIPINMISSPPLLNV